MKIRDRFFLLILFVSAAMIGSSIYMFMSFQSISILDNTKNTVENANVLLSKIIANNLRLARVNEINNYYSKLKQNTADFESGLAELEKLLIDNKILTTDKERKKLKAVGNTWEGAKPQLKKLDELITPFLVAASSLDLISLHDYKYNQNNYGATLAVDVIEKLDFYFSSSIDLRLKEMGQIIQEKTSVRVTSIQTISMLNSLIILLSLITILLLFVRKLKKQLHTQDTAIKQIIDGDLSKRLEIKGNDELSEISTGFNVLVDNMTMVIDNIHELSVDTVKGRETVSVATSKNTTAVNEISGSIKQVSSKIEHLVTNLLNAGNSTGKIRDSISKLNEQLNTQSSAVSESSASIEEMNASIENISRISSQYRKSTEDLAKLALDEGEHLNDMKKMIDENTESITEIINIVSLIDNIAGQTNLLSMNAAIEAAHAGDSGKGFSVVAEEIRKLSESTNENAKRINVTVTKMADRIHSVETSSRDTIAVYERIEADTKISVQAMAEITSTLQELFQGSTEIINAMTELTDITVGIVQEARNIETSTVDVDTAMDNIQQIGKEVKQGISMLISSSNEISNSMQDVYFHNEENGKAIEKLRKKVDQYYIHRNSPDQKFRQQD